MARANIELTLEHIRTSAGPRFDWYADDEQRRQALIQYFNEVHAEGPMDEIADASLDEVVEAIEEFEDVSTEEMSIPFPDVFVLVIDSDSGGTSTHVFSTYRRALEFLCDDSEIEHAGKTDEELQDLLEAHFENSEDWYVLNQEEVLA
jgi:hypothetical protein